MIEPRLTYDVVFYNYDVLNGELKKYTDKRTHSAYVVNFKHHGNVADFSVINRNGSTGEEKVLNFQTPFENIFSVRNVLTGKYTYSTVQG